MKQGVTHAEFIRGVDGELYFLEIAARVGGANIAEMIEAATGAQSCGLNGQRLSFREMMILMRCSRHANCTPGSLSRLRGRSGRI
jgi:hypothetical protein